MKAAAFIPLLGFGFNLFLALFILRFGVRVLANRVYSFLGFSFAIWEFGQFMLHIEQDEAQALFWGRFLWMGVIFIPVLLYHLSLLVANVRRPASVNALYVWSGFLAAANLTPLFITGIRPTYTSGWYVVPGPLLYCYFFLPFTVVIYTLYLLFKKRQQLPRLHKARINALILAQTCLVVFGANDMLPILRIDVYPLTKIPVYPYGAWISLFYGIIVGYSVLQRHLLDIQLTVSHFAAQFIRFGFLFVLGAGMLLGLVLIFPRHYDTLSFFASLAVLIATTIVGSLFFPRLFTKNSSERLERWILGDRFEYQDRVRAFINELPFYSDTDLLLTDLDNLLSNTIGLKHFKIILLDENTHAFKLFRAFPPEKDRLYPEIHADCDLFHYFQRSKRDYLLLAPQESGENPQSLEEKARRETAHFNAQFCFLFRWEERPYGLLLLGDKVSNDPFTESDLNLMGVLVKNISIIVNQIRLKNQILHVQELDLLGRMSRGMAHDLNNLLTPIWTFLQLTSEGIPSADLNDDLLPVALRNIKTMRAYIREALFFSEHLRPDIQQARLDSVLVHAADLVRPRSEKRAVNVVVEVPGEVMAELDEVLVQRMMANLIANAIDASPEQATVRVELLRLVRTEVDRDWLRVRVIDHGEGIKPENLDRVLTPYFTTKNSGDETRGFGLGLTICKKIAHLHGGQLNISSQWKKGTTVQVDLPSRQIKAQPPAALTLS